MAPDDARIQWALANTLWRVGRGREAVPVYERVIALLPNEPAPRCNLAELLAVLDRVNDTRVQIASAAAFAPDDPHIYLAETVVRLKAGGRLPRRSLLRAVASGTLPEFAYLGLGDALLAQGKTNEALAAYRAARQHCVPEDLRTMRQDLDWLATVYPTLPKATHQQVLAIFTAEGGRD